MILFRLSNSFLKISAHTIKYRFVRHASQSCTSFSDVELTAQGKHLIEDYWRDKLNKVEFDPKKSDSKYVVVPMFPYPSGYLHLGHVRVYTLSDSMARFARLQGKNVLHPIGWDAFGLPAENAAIERNIPPVEWTNHNIEYMRKQLGKLGCSFDWNRELSTCDPNYYRWTQWIFLQMLKDGMAFQREALVNWDPVDQTVLANEQVSDEGLSWRSGAKVERRLLKQWFIKSTKYAKELYEGLDDPMLEDWQEIRKIQRNWIGEPTGYSFDLELLYLSSPKDHETKLRHVKIWTEKPELLMNPSFIAIKSNHLLNESGKTDSVLDIVVKNPFNEGTTIPIIVSDELEFSPSCDTYLGLASINPIDKQICENHWFTIDESPPLEKHRESIIKKAKNKNIGGYLCSPRIHDWLISRQRYWGTPIPVVHCKKCGTVPVPDAQLPIELPAVTRDESGKPIPLSKRIDWLKTTCPKCKSENAQRESDTMDTFFDSSWYFLRYLSPNSNKHIFDKSLVKKFMPVDLYVGGIEHAVLHLYIARFVMQFLHKLNLVPTAEPFKKLLPQGMVNGRTYLTNDGRYLPEEEVSILNEKQNKAEEISTGMAVQMEWEKMSKSKRNGVDPLDLFAEYGVDTIRMIMLGDVAPKTPRNWSKLTFPGILKWQHRIWLCVNEFNKARQNETLEKPEDDKKYNEEIANIFDLRNHNLCRITTYYDQSSFSNVIKHLLAFTDDLRRPSANTIKYSDEYERALANLIIMLSPIAPHFASELWSKFASVPNRVNENENELIWSKDVLEQNWPKPSRDFQFSLKIVINKKTTVFRFPRESFDSLTRKFAMTKLEELEDYKKMVDKHKITHIAFTDYDGLVALLTVNSKPKKKSGKEERETQSN